MGSAKSIMKTVRGADGLLTQVELGSYPQGGAAEAEAALDAAVRHLVRHEPARVLERERLDELGARPSLLNPLWYAGAFGLGALKVELQRILTQCAGGKIADCRVIEALGDHSLCATDHRHPEIEATQ